MPVQRLPNGPTPTMRVRSLRLAGRAERLARGDLRDIKIRNRRGTDAERPRCCVLTSILSLQVSRHWARASAAASEAMCVPVARPTGGQSGSARGTDGHHHL